MARAKYQVPNRVRRGSHRRRVSHALGNSRISGYTDDLGDDAAHNRALMLAIFAALLLVGLAGVIF